MKYTNLLDVVKINNQSVKEFSGTRLYIATGDVDEEGIKSFSEITYDGRPSRANVEVEKGQVVFARMKATNKVLLIDDLNVNNIYSTGFCALDPSEEILSEYLKIVLKSKVFQAQKDKYSKGATQEAINNKGIKQIKIPLPSLKDQERIVSIFNALEQILYYRKKQIRALSNLKQSIFYDMFGDPLKNNEFKRVQIKDIGKVITGNTPSKKVKENYGDFIEWIKTDNITFDDIHPSRAKLKLSKTGAEKGRIIEENCLLVACIAGSIRSIGKAVITDRKVAINQQINAIVPDSDSINIYFLYMQVLMLKNYFEQSSTSSMKGMISKSNFEKLEIVLPPLNKQIDYANKFVEVMKVQKDLEKSLNYFERLYDSSMQKAFKGDLF